VLREEIDRSSMFEEIVGSSEQKDEVNAFRNVLWSFQNHLDWAVQFPLIFKALRTPGTNRSR
jgi:hypothetical protein